MRPGSIGQIEWIRKAGGCQCPVDKCHKNIFKDAAIKKAVIYYLFWSRPVPVPIPIKSAFSFSPRGGGFLPPLCPSEPGNMIL
jgi:hypothetical protein